MSFLHDSLSLLPKEQGPLCAEFPLSPHEEQGPLCAEFSPSSLRRNRPSLRLIVLITAHKTVHIQHGYGREVHREAYRDVLREATYLPGYTRRHIQQGSLPGGITRVV